MRRAIPEPHGPMAVRPRRSTHGPQPRYFRIWATTFVNDRMSRHWSRNFPELR
jgi:hypothetical protein